MCNKSATMRRRKDISDFARGFIAGACSHGASVGKVIRAVNVSRQTASRVYQEWRFHRKRCNAKKGRKRIISGPAKRRLKIITRRRRRGASIVEITTAFNRGRHILVSTSTISRELRRTTI